MNRFKSPIITGLVCLALTAVLSPEARANSRFTIQNKGSYQLEILIFNGGDKVCAASTKTKFVDAGNSGTYGCEGNGHHRCKIQVRRKADGQKDNKFCAGFYNNCSGKTMAIENTGLLIVPDDTNECERIQP